MKKFSVTLALIFALNAAGAFAAAKLAERGDVPFSYWLSLIFIAALTYIVHRQLIAANEKRAQLFVTYFMGALTVKLFLSVILLVVVGLTAKDELAFTAVGYMIAYAVFTAAEVKDLLPRMKNER